MHHINLDTLHLDEGAHGSRNDGLCLLEAVAYFADEPHSDTPTCVSRVLINFGQSLNDRLPDDERQRLVPLIPTLVGTRDDGLDGTRGYLALDWLIRTYTPAWLDLAGLSAQAQELRGLRRIDDLAAAQAAGPVVRSAQSKAAAAWAAAGDAAGAAARAAAGAAAWAAAGDAAGDAAGAAAGAAAWAAAWAAARDAARDAAGAAAWAAAWAAARDAARDAARAAAGAAAGAALKPTVDQLQHSAIELFAAMARPAALVAA